MPVKIHIGIDYRGELFKNGIRILKLVLIVYLTENCSEGVDNIVFYLVDHHIYPCIVVVEGLAVDIRKGCNIAHGDVVDILFREQFCKC